MSCSCDLFWKKLLFLLALCRYLMEVIRQTFKTTNRSKRNLQCPKALKRLFHTTYKLNLIFIYELLDCLAYSENNPLELVPSSNYELRDNEMKIVVPRYKTRNRANFIPIKYANIWNRLSRQICTISNLNTFKQNLNKYLEMPGLLHLLGLDHCNTVDLTKGLPNI